MDCCIPQWDSKNLGHRDTTYEHPEVHATSFERVKLSGGFLMGTEDIDCVAADGEGPIREVVLSPFSIAPTTVTNEEFARFVDATKYQTDAEVFGWSFVFNQFISRKIAKTIQQVVTQTPWWWQVPEASWKQPEGADSGIDDRPDHPVVHISWNDAQAYCNWSSSRLPTEAEWEFAARGGLIQNRYPWGNNLTPEGQHKCNIWQGSFPAKNTLEDGYAGTAPAKSYEPNAYGIYNASGNVWEWCADWSSKVPKPVDNELDPEGPPEGTSKVTKGGSYLCHASYCNRYRVSARSSATPDSSTGNMGFRTVAL